MNKTDGTDKYNYVSKLVLWIVGRTLLEQTGELGLLSAERKQKALKYITQVQQQRSESPRITLT